jgi:hypothetical protein
MFRCCFCVVAKSLQNLIVSSSILPKPFDKEAEEGALRLLGFKELTE